MKRIFALGAAGLMLPAVAPAQVVLDDNMSTSTNWVVNRTRDAGATFGDNWSAVAIDATAGLPGNVVPASPTSTTVGLRMEVNNNAFDGDTAAITAGLTVWATTAPATSNYNIEVDLFAAYSAPPIDLGGTGSTENFGIVFQNDNITSIATTRSTGLTAARNPADSVTVVDFSSTASATGLLNNGLVFGFNPDMGNGIGTVPTNVNSNIWLYDRASSQFEAPGRTNSRGFVGNWAGAKGTTGFNIWDSPARLASRALTVPAQAEVNSLYQDIYVPTRVAPANTGLGYLWVKPNIQVRGNAVTLRINNFVVATYTSTKTGKRVGLSMEDPFTGVNTPFLGRNYISRVKIEDVTILADAADWALYE
jgi:hypothetical protein